MFTVRVVEGLGLPTTSELIDVTVAQTLSAADKYAAGQPTGPTLLRLLMS